VVVSREPAPDLRPYIRRYYGFREETFARTQRREGPGAEVVVLLSFGPQWRVGDATNPARPSERLTSFVGGVRMTSVLTEHAGLAHGMQVSLTPPGAYALFGLPMHELAGSTVPLECLLGSEADLLVERLATQHSWMGRFALLERALAQRLREAPLPTPGVVWAWHRLDETHGRVPVGELVDGLGWSPKRLVYRFRNEVGVSPKSLARLLRFEQAATLLERRDRPGLAAVAAGCGYYDQSHLTNEFRRITGVTPAAFADSTNVATFLQDSALQRS
jgi:AraC-like DNA-binding protein